MVEYRIHEGDVWGSDGDGSCACRPFCSTPPDNLSIQEFQKNEAVDVEVRTGTRGHPGQPSATLALVLTLMPLSAPL